MPDTLGQCIALQLLNVVNNQLTTLPDTIGQCTALEIIHAYNNQLTTLPDTLRQCAALWKLWITENNLTALPNGLQDNIFYDGRNKINKLQCLALQKKAPINTEEAQERSSLRFR